MAESEQPWTENPPRLDVAIVGTGRTGSVIGAALRRAGHKVVACTAVSEVSRLRAESLLPGVPIKSVEDAVAACDAVFLTVPDDVLPQLVAGLAQTKALSPGTFVIHTSGRYGVDVLSSLTSLGMLPMALHPVMTFTGTSVDLNRLSGCPFGVTAPDILRHVAEALVVEIGGEPVWVPENHRALYHAALAFGSNGLMTLVHETIRLLTVAGVEDPERMIAPLFGASLDNALRHGISAVTGPVMRGDIGTVREHIAALSDYSADTLPSYLAMARLTADRALENGRVSPETVAALLEVLGDQ